MRRRRRLLQVLKNTPRSPDHKSAGAVVTRPEGGAPVTGLCAEERWFPAGKACQILSPGSAPGFFPGAEFRGIPVLAVH
jgi:hypothetical protein